MNDCGLCALAFALIVGGPVLAADNLASSDRVKIPAGSFTMGQDGGPQDERPAHQVSVGAFEIDRVIPPRDITISAFAAPNKGTATSRRMHGRGARA